ncbi:MAG TPA: hypothetical protein ENG63_06575 [Candidatus Desulfofervidus auxilii]|uniref:Uncharacterized protein n=1 Tax=Desulfofervidus auxilii TaxID=1621989 RepID=A0A7C0U3I2_DESA2|nr:hypothetical protein [Candidatus Desulfofervidus auxilii]
MKLCDICKETISIGNCPICKKALCRYCAYYMVSHFSGKKKFYFEFINPIPKKEVEKGGLAIICENCLQKIARIWRKKKYREKRMKSLSHSFFDVLVKLSVLEKVA